MFTKKFITTALAATVLFTATAVTTAPAMAAPHHHHHHGWGWGAGGLAAGMLIGSAIAASSGAVEEEPARRCYLVERVNRWGEIVTRRVCRWE